MKQYRGRDGRERLWFDDGEIDRMMEAELRRASLLPSEAAPAVNVERFIERHLKVHLDQHADLDASVLGLTEFFAEGPPKISINKVLTGSALDEDETSPGVLGRWRATLAHEASHVLLHRCLFEFAKGNMSLFGSADDQKASGGSLQRCLKRDVSYQVVSDWREVQANQGLAALLMPKSLFLKIARGEIARAFPGREQVPAGSEERIVPTLASKFEVSKQAARIRLGTLSLISGRADRHLAKAGQGFRTLKNLGGLWC
jgi:hypothetical protein